MIKLSDLPVTNNTNPMTSDYGDFEIKRYVPLQSKIEFINYVIQNSMDENTFNFSPVVLKSFFDVALAKWYTDIEIDDSLKIYDIYDKLASNHIIEKIYIGIPGEELAFLRDCVYTTASDITRYNQSFAGMMGNLSEDTGSMSEQIKAILENIKNGEGLEQLSAIKDIAGRD
jgi:hypothetical protein